MIDPATGMKSGERYSVELLGDTHPFTGFFLDGQYYLTPDLPPAVGWLEGQKFIYDDRDPAGTPIFPDRIAGTISHLSLTLVSGESLQLATVKTDSPDPSKPNVASTGPKKHQTGPLRGKLVVITGASSGIGRATAKAFACKGARLVLAARDEEALFEVLDECTDCGTDAVAVATDVTSSEEMIELATRAAAFGNGRIDIWINNAGIGAVGTFEDTPLEAHERVLQTDLMGYLRGAYVAMPYFKAQKSGTLINTMSIGSWVAQPYAVAYSASKFGLRGLTEALRGELTEFTDIHVCDIYPAVMDTPGFRDGGNYTGHALKPPPPVYNPELVAQAMVACAIKPRATTTVGAAAYVARLAPFLVPGLTSISGWLTRKGINRSPTSATSSGNLFSPPSGVRSVEGGWRKAQHTSPALLAVTAAVLGGGVAFVIFRKKRRQT
ncbi:short chain dehydrogenase [Pseudomonas fluorescens]|uniref:Short chain dehydrogenase n=1 Tax=Pseudomonas fluorescens TaxID=294 RepID=A0A448DYM9_PSEFL|nr:SDR family oxidoreductase [Pseudomonas fluorescens]VEF11913.1 short chain dehydrogenase [Pseudomonas fluorescens]